MNDVIAWLSGWYNWPFLLVLAIGLLFIAADVFLGGLSDLIGLDADADFDVDVPDIDFDIDANVDAHVGGAHVDVDWDPDVAAAKAGGFVKAGMAWMGMGKVPVSVLLQILTISFGSTGLLINALAGDMFPGGSNFSFPVAIIAAVFMAVFLTKTLGSTIAKLVPADATTSKKPHAFVGQIGITASRVTLSIGQVCIPEVGNQPQTILNARLEEGGNLTQGIEVLLTGYDSEQNTYLVAPTNNLEL